MAGSKKARMAAFAKEQAARLERQAPAIRWALDHSRDQRRVRLAREIARYVSCAREMSFYVFFLSAALDDWEKRYGRRRDHGGAGS